MGDSEESEIRKRKMNVYGNNKEPDTAGSEKDRLKILLEKEEQKRKKSFVIYIPKWLLYLSLLSGIVAVVWSRILSGFFFPNEPDDFYTLGQEGLTLFKKYDRNGDDQLSIAEYESLYHQLIGNGLNLTEFEYKPEQLIEEDDQILTMKAYFKPLLLETMTKDMNDKFFGQLDSLSGLKEWTKTSQEWMNFGVRHFKVFLPPGQIDLGSVYQLYSDRQSHFSIPQLSSNRFYPSKVDDDVIVLHRLLMMFHPRPFLVTRFPPKGGFAVVRAYSEKYIDVVFRFHAEFQLNEPPYNPFWYTPGQFTGHLIISQDYQQILYFNMYVPTEKKLNVDMEWLNGPDERDNMEVDIGYMPLMMVNNTAMSRTYRNRDEVTGEVPVDSDEQFIEEIKNIKWTEEITEEEAFRLLEVKMYPFKEVQYYNFTETVKKAKDEDKLIHCILLWGALDDQSC